MARSDAAAAACPRSATASDSTDRQGCPRNGRHPAKPAPHQGWHGLCEDSGIDGQQQPAFPPPTQYGSFVAPGGAGASPHPAPRDVPPRIAGLRADSAGRGVGLRRRFGPRAGRCRSSSSDHGDFRWRTHGSPTGCHWAHPTSDRCCPRIAGADRFGRMVRVTHGPGKGSSKRTAPRPVPPARLPVQPPTRLDRHQRAVAPCTRRQYVP